MAIQKISDIDKGSIQAVEGIAKTSIEAMDGITASFVTYDSVATMGTGSSPTLRGPDSDEESGRGGYRPVIDYALATIRRSGISDITIVGNQFIGQIAQHVGTGLPGETIHYVIEEEPLGVHHALNLARPYVEGSRMLLYFSDNITTADLHAIRHKTRKLYPTSVRSIQYE